MKTIIDYIFESINKIIHGTIYVPDCEHLDDINRYKYMINKIPECTVNDYYWDKQDCGEAYIEFTFNSKDFLKVYVELYNHDPLYSESIYRYTDADTLQKMIDKKFYDGTPEKSIVSNEIRLNQELNGDFRYYDRENFTEKDYKSTVNIIKKISACDIDETLIHDKETDILGCTVRFIFKAKYLKYIVNNLNNYCYKKPQNYYLHIYDNKFNTVYNSSSNENNIKKYI